MQIGRIDEMKKKKNRFWLFVFSLLPGAGHMYMGFMKMGLSFMLGFMLMIGVIGITNISVFLVLAITLYIYSFFHANNIGVYGVLEMGRPFHGLASYGVDPFKSGTCGR